MNQHDQMREALLCAEVTLRSVLEYPDFDCDCEHEPRPICSMAKRAVAAIEQAIAAEPAPLVRLTDEEIWKLWHELPQPTGKYAIARYAEEIMDAMERVNRRQLDQTPNSPSE